MKINTYIKKNWAKLPKSTFNNEEIVIFFCVTNEDEGWGHHNYNGYGVNKEGEIYWCYSSGCSCDGSCEIEHKKDLKQLKVEGLDISSFDHSTIDFESLRVDFSDY